MIDLRINAKEDAMKVFHEIPNHGEQGLGDDARIIVPGNPSKSVLFNRVSRATEGRMPPMGSESPDNRAIGLLLQWILAKGEEANRKQPAE